MGGCLSSGTGKCVEKVQQVVVVKQPEVEEEAVVKEVLSETPKLSSAAQEHHAGEFGKNKTSIDFDEEETCSEICYERGHEMDEKEFRVQSPCNKLQRKRSISGDFLFSSDQRLAGGGFSSPSHSRKADRGAPLGRSFSGMENSNAPQNPGVGSTRRIGSPMTTRMSNPRLAGRMSGNGVSRTPSLRGMGRDSPSRTMSLKGTGRESPGSGYLDSGMWEAQTENPEATRGKESLENPLVSLECFIFL